MVKLKACAVSSKRYSNFAVYHLGFEPAMLLKKSSLPEVFCKKGVLRNYAKFTGKHLCQSLFFNKVAGLERTPLMAASVKRDSNTVVMRNIKKEAKNKLHYVQRLQLH